MYRKLLMFWKPPNFGFLKGRSYEMPLLAVRIAISIAMERGMDLIKIIALFDARNQDWDSKLRTEFTTTIYRLMIL